MSSSTASVSPIEMEGSSDTSRTDTDRRSHHKGHHRNHHPSAASGRGGHRSVPPPPAHHRSFTALPPAVRNIFFLFVFRTFRKCCKVDDHSADSDNDIQGLIRHSLQVGSSVLLILSQTQQVAVAVRNSAAKVDKIAGRRSGKRKQPTLR